VAAPVVAIIGRPNVGKSTLFNRLIGERRAIVDETAGLTRDRLYGQVAWRRRRFTLVDTAGLDFEASSDLRRELGEQTRLAITASQLVLFVVDARAGVQPLDREVAQLLRRGRVPYLLVGNKSEPALASAHELYELGLGEPIPVSAAHGTGTGDLLDQVVAALPPEVVESEPAALAARIAIVGRPNVGKSSLLNAVLGDRRSVVAAEPGTTRDPVDTVLERDGQRVLLIDTAGIRRRGAVGTNVEHYSLLRSLRALERADVAFLVLDAREGVRAQDQHIAGYAVEAGVGLIVVLNKWDLLKPAERDPKVWRKALERILAFAPFAPICEASALRGMGTAEALVTALAVSTERLRRIPTPELNRVIGQSTDAHAPPTHRGKRLTVLYATQAVGEGGPPTFQIFVNDPALVHFSYRRYLENRIRHAFGFRGTPIRLVFRARREAPGTRGSRGKGRAGKKRGPAPAGARPPRR
jgi:GTP-binding protein